MIKVRWKLGTAQDGSIEEDKDAAEITGPMTRPGNWLGGLRWIVRRVKPSRRQMRNLTDWDRKTGWRYSTTCTNIPGSGIEGVPGSHHAQYIDVVHRQHAVVVTACVRTAKAMGLRGLPSKTWQVNAGWVAAANIAADLATRTRLLGHAGEPELRDVGPDTLRYRIWHLPAKLAAYARQKTPAISPDWPWAEAFLTCGQRLCTPCRHPPELHRSLSDMEGGPSRRGRSRCAPATRATSAPPAPEGNGHKAENGCLHNQ
jgi:hypothetical protein